jgi:hypothetical protein
LLLVSLMALAGCANEPSVVRTVVRLTATGGAVVVTATGGPAGVTPAAPAAAATQTPQAGSTPAPQNTPAAGATEEVGERVVLQFVTTLSTIEEVDHIADLLSDEDGILAVTGTEVSLTITYDPAAITIDQLKAVMERIGYPVK